MATIDYKQLATPEANLIELLAAQNQDGTYSAKLMGSEPFAVLAAKTIYNAYNDIEDNMAADVEGPASSTDNAVARFNGTTGKLLQNSLVTIDDSGGVFVPESLNITNIGLITGIFFSSSSQQRGQIIYTGGAIRFLSGVTTNGLIVGSSTSQLQFDNSGLATLTGNLTVSGVTTSAGISNSGALTFTAAIGQVAGSIAKNATYGLTYHGVTGSSNDNTMLNASGAVVLSNPAGTTNATLAGNLTVSGTATVNGSTIRAAASTNGAARGLEFYNTGNSALFGTIKADYTTGIIAYDAGAAVYGSNHVFTHGTTAGSVTLSAGSITATGNLTVSGTGTSSFAGNVTVTGTGTIYTAIDTGSFVKFGNNITSSNLQVGAQGFGAVIQGAQSGSAAYNILAQPYGGNVLIGKSTPDTGEKLQVSGTIAASLGVSSNGALAAYPAANSAAMDWYGGYARFWGVGADASTAGGIKLIVSSTDGSPAVDALTIVSSGDATFAGTVTTTGLITVTGTTASIANGATADITLNTPNSLVGYYVRSEGNSNDQSSGFYRSNNNGASSAFVLFGQSEANVAVTTPAAGTIRITNNTGGTIAFAYAFTVLVKR